MPKDATPPASFETPPEERRPPFRILGPARAPWREAALTRVGELRVLLALVEQGGPVPTAARQAIEAQLHAAEQAAVRSRGLRERVRQPGSSALERATSELDAAEASLLRIAPDRYVIGQLPSLLAQARSHLPKDDPRLQRLARLCEQYREVGSALGGPAPAAPALAPRRRWRRGPPSGGAAPEEKLDPADRSAIIAAFRAGAAEARKAISRVRSFSMILYSAAGVMTALVLVLAAVGIVRARVIPVCFVPGDRTLVCPIKSDTNDGKGFLTPAAAGQPSERDDQEVSEALDRATTGWDIAVVELLGLLAAAVAGAAALRRLGGTSTPYKLPLAASVLKLPTGALTAVLGILLMRGGFVPGLSDLDTSAQILAWAVIFGYAQELFTRMVDSKAETVLNDVGSPTKTKAPEVQVGADVAGTA
jgi:hypothetical protein